MVPAVSSDLRVKRESRKEGRVAWGLGPLPWCPWVSVAKGRHLVGGNTCMSRFDNLKVSGSITPDRHADGPA